MFRTIVNFYLFFHPPFGRKIVSLHRNLLNFNQLWGIVLKPQLPHTKQTYEQKYGCKTVELPYFEDLGSGFVQIFVNVFALHVVGVTRAFSEFLLNFSQLQSSLVSVKQVMQDKNTRIS